MKESQGDTTVKMTESQGEKEEEEGGMERREDLARSGDRGRRETLTTVITVTRVTRVSTPLSVRGPGEREKVELHISYYTPLIKASELGHISSEVKSSLCLK